MAFFEIYKPGQGKYTRVTTFVSAIGIGLLGAVALSGKLGAWGLASKPLIQYGAPAVLVIVLGLFMFRAVNKPRSADFLIATEGEMKKVSWSSRKEIIGSTKVVIVTTFILAAVLLGVDMTFRYLFKWMGIVRF